MTRRVMSLSEVLRNVDEATVFDFDGEYLGKVVGAGYDFKKPFEDCMPCPVIDVKFRKGKAELYILSTCKVVNEV